MHRVILMKASVIQQTIPLLKLDIFNAIKFMIMGTIKI